MKVEAKPFPPLLQPSKSVAKFSRNHLLRLLAFVALLAGGMVSNARAADTSSLGIIRQLSKEGLTCPKYVDAVVALIKSSVKDYLASPKGKKNPAGQYDIVNDIVAEAVKSRPPCACDIVKAGIQALTPENGNADPKLVASMVAEVVQYLQSSNPELLETIVTCATEADPEAGKLILNAVAGILATPQGTKNNLNINLPNGVSTPTPTPTATPKPVAPTPPPQVTPVVPI